MNYFFRQVQASPNQEKLVADTIDLCAADLNLAWVPPVFFIDECRSDDPNLVFQTTLQGAAFIDQINEPDPIPAIFFKISSDPMLIRVTTAQLMMHCYRILKHGKASSSAAVKYGAKIDKIMRKKGSPIKFDPEVIESGNC